MINRIDMVIDGVETSVDVVGAYVIEGDVYLLMRDNFNHPRAYKVLSRGIVPDDNMVNAVIQIHNNEMAVMQAKMSVKRPIDIHLHIDENTSSDKLMEIINAIK